MAYKKKFGKKVCCRAKKTWRRPKKVGKAIKKAIRREIARDVETKSAQQFNYNQNIYPSDHASFPNNVFELGPSALMAINQGTSNGSRVGNKIKTKRLTFKGTIVPLGYNVTTNPNMVPMQGKIWIFYDRTDPTAIPAVTTNFFQNGSTNAAFQNDLVDLWRPVNTDRYRVLATKTFKLGFADNAGTGASAANQNFANNDFKLNYNFSFDLTKWYPKVVKYDENNATPMTRGLFALFDVVPASGGFYPATTVPAGMQWMQDYRYEDA